MEKLTFAQIIEVLKEKYDDVSEFAYQDDFEDNELGLGEIEEVFQEGGEGEGEHWESVKHFKDHDVYISVSGYYSSYDGTDFDGWEACTEVRPKEKTITVYE